MLDLWHLNGEIKYDQEGPTESNFMLIIFYLVAFIVTFIFLSIHGFLVLLAKDFCRDKILKVPRAPKDI